MKRAIFSILLFVATLSVCADSCAQNQRILRFALDSILNSQETRAEYTINSGTIAGPVHITDLKYHAPGYDLHIKNLVIDWSIPSAITLNPELKNIHASDVVIDLRKHDNQADITQSINALFRQLKITNSQLTNVHVKKPNGDTFFSAENIRFSVDFTKELITLNEFHYTTADHYANANGHIEKSKNFPVNLNIQWENTKSPLRGESTLSGTLNKLKIANETVAPYSTIAVLEISQLLNDDATIEGRVDLVNLDLSTWLGKRDINAIGNVDISGALRKPDFDLKIETGSTDLTIESNFTGTIDTSKLVINHGLISSDHYFGKAEIQGSHSFSSNNFQFQLEWSQISKNSNKHSIPNIVSDGGEALLSGTPTSPKLVAFSKLIKIGSSRFENTKLSIEPYSEQDLDISFAASIGSGQIDGLINLNYNESVVWQGVVQIEDLDLVHFRRGLPSNLEGELELTGSYDNQNLNQTFYTKSLKGLMGLEPLLMSGGFSTENKNPRFENLKIEIGKSHYALNGGYRHGNPLKWHIKKGRLKHISDFFDTKLSGNFSTDGEINLSQEKEILIRNIKLSDIHYIDKNHQELFLGKANGSFLLNEKNVKRSAITFEQLNIGQKNNLSGNLTTKGTLSHHKLELELNGNTANASIKLQSTLQNNRYNSIINAIEFNSDSIGYWNNQDESNIHLSPEKIELKPTCLYQRKSSICFGSDFSIGGDWKLSGRFNDTPISLFTSLFNSDFVSVGDSNGYFFIKGHSSQLTETDINIILSGGEISFPKQLNGDSSFRYSPTELRVSFDCEKFRTNDIAFSCNDFLENMELKTKIAFESDSLDFVNSISSHIDRTSGNLQATIDLSGSINAPNLQATVDIKNGSLFSPTLGISIRDIRIEGTSANQTSILFTGKGFADGKEIQLNGEIDLASYPTTSAWEIKGQNVVIFNKGKNKVHANPVVKISSTGRNIQVEGTIPIPKAQLSQHNFQSTSIISSDVVYIDELARVDSKKDESRIFPIKTNLLIVAGDEVHIDGYGISGKINGSVAIEHQTGSPLLGNGTLHIKDALYRAYGVKLDIDIGRLLYSNSPIANPLINVRASRRANQIIAGVNVQGTLQTPEISTFSQPYMSENDIISVILFGRVSSGYSTTFDSFGQGSDEGLEFGMMLSPGYYFDYLVSAINSGAVMRLRYELTDRIELRAESGSNYQAADIFINFEK